jgi:hypothetical protein
VSLAAGDSAYREVGDDGSIAIELPAGNGDRKYTFQVTALPEKKNDEGETVQQEIQFFFVLKCEFTMDLEMELEEPFPTSVIAITAAIPITIPRVVRRDRVGFRRSARNAS